MIQETLAPGVVMLQGDCLEILPRISSVDSILTDPPYSERMQNGYRDHPLLRNDGGSQRKTLDFEPINQMLEPFLAQVKRINRGWLLAFADVTGVGTWQESLRAHHLKPKATCIWLKPDAIPQINGQGPAGGFDTIVTAWCGQGLPRWNGGGKRGIFTHPTNSPERRLIPHPTVKPLSLMKELVELFTDQDDLVLDPFAGSATTGVACIKLQRRFLGIEQNPKYFELACTRLQRTLDDPDFFFQKPKKLVDSFWRATPSKIPRVPRVPKLTPKTNGLSSAPRHNGKLTLPPT